MCCYDHLNLRPLDSHDLSGVKKEEQRGQSGLRECYGWQNFPDHAPQAWLSIADTDFSPFTYFSIYNIYI